MDERVRIVLPQPVPVGFVGLGDRIVGALGAATKTVKDDEENRQGLHEKIYIT
jgi:hypothetical protein